MSLTGIIILICGFGPSLVYSLNGCSPTPGECDSGNFIEEFVTQDALECQAACRANSECKYYTYYPDAGACIQYSACSSESDTDCMNGECLSGTSDCFCSISGQCEGTSVQVDFTESMLNCSRLCAENPACNWWNYDPDDSLCLMLANCTLDLEPECSHCVTGESFCYYDIGSVKALFVVGGYGNTGNYAEHVEVIPLDRPDLVCPTVPAITLDTLYTAGFLHHGEPVACGSGYGDNRCLIFNLESWEWEEFHELPSARTSAVGVQFEEDWYLTGGFGNPEYTNTSVYYTDTTDEFITGPEILLATSDHCIVPLNSTHAVFSGGWNHDGSHSNVYMYDNSAKSFSVLPSMSVNRHMHACGLATPENEAPYLVVASGPNSQTTETFSVGDTEWQSGVNIPMVVTEGTSVPYENGFLIVGGQDLATFHLSIWQYDPADASMPWRLRPEQLKSYRSNFPVVVVMPATDLGCDLP